MKKRLAVTIDEKLYEQIVKLAKLDNRNLSNFVETLLKKSLDK